MATMITEDCIRCSLCEPDCVGFHAQEACASVCPVDCCVPDPNNLEDEAVLLARARKIHPEQADAIVLGPDTSRFRAGR